MSEYASQSSGSERDRSDAASNGIAPSPGKQTLVEQAYASGPPVQRQASGEATAGDAPPPRSDSLQRVFGRGAVVQRKVDDTAGAADPAAAPAGAAGDDASDVTGSVRAVLAGISGSAVEGSCNVTTESIASKIFVATGGKVRPDRVYNDKHYVLRIGDTIVDPTAAQFVNYPPGTAAPILVGTEPEVRAQFAALVDQYKIRHDSQKQPGAPFVPTTINSASALAEFAYGGGSVRQYGDALVARPSGKAADYNTDKNNEIKAQKQAEAAAPAAARPATAPPGPAASPGATGGGSGGVSVHPIIDVGGAPAADKPITPLPILPITASQGAEVRDGKATAVPVASADPSAAARELQPKLVAQAQAARTAYQPLADEQARLEAAIAAAPEDQKPVLQAQKKDVDDKLGKVQRDLKQLDADLKALDDPRSTRDTFNQILARQKSGVGVASDVEIDRHDGELEKKWSQNRDTTTTTSYADGKATKQVEDSTSKVGLGSYSQSNVKSTDVVTADGKTSTVDSRTTKIDKDGLSYDKSVSQSEDKDGKTSSVDNKTSVKVGPGGASRTDTTTTVAADGSSASHATTAGVERGDGKLGATRGTTDVKKDAAGNEVTDSTKVKGGMIAGKDGYGGYGSAERTYENKSAEGNKLGAVAGLDGNVVCNIEPVPSSDPPKYRVSLTVNLGAKLGASAGHDKEGGTGTASVGVSASGNVSLNRTYVLGDDETKEYVAALKAASSGSGGGDKKEMAIIRAGVTHGWPAAQDLYLAATKGAADPDAVDKLKDGESIKVEKSENLGATGSLGAKGDGSSLAISGGYEVGHSSSLEVGRQDGKLTYDAKEKDTDKLSGGAELGVGPAVSGSFGASHTNVTSTGYKIVVDPAAPNAGEMKAALAACKSQDDLDAFARKYPASVQEKTKETGSVDTQSAGVSVLGVKAGLNFNQGLDEQVTTDGSGKFKSKTVTGTSGGGAEIGVGNYKIGASEQDAAVAQVDAEGNAAVDVNRSTSETNAAKWLGANVPFAGDKQDDKGTLAKLAGDKSKEDTDDHDVSGMKLKGSDLGYLGYIAVNEWGKWMSACPSPRLRDDWAAAGRSIRAAGGDKAAVAEALAKFVGSGGSSDVVYAAVRSPGDVSGGSRYEFPGGLAQRKPQYDALVIGDSETALDAIAQSDGKDKAIAKATDMLAQLDSLDSAVSSASGFTQPAVQAEMQAAINARRDKVRAKLRVLNGGKGDVMSRQELLDKYNSLIQNCVRHQQSETEMFAKIDATYKDGEKPSLGEGIDNATLIKQLRDMYAVWNTEYDEMAALAQENGFGQDNYWKFKPDLARFNRALTGAPGAASAPTPETADKRKKQPVAQAPRDPVGDANRELDKKRAEQASTIHGQIDPAKNRAYGAGNRLYAWIQTDHNAAAIDAHNRGMVTLHSADGYAARMPKNPTTEDFESYGYIAVQDYDNATATFKEGLAHYPPGSPPKPQ